MSNEKLTSHFFFFGRAVEELITLIENVADSVSMGQCNPDSMSLLLANLRIHGPQLEDYSKSTLDQGECSLFPPLSPPSIEARMNHCSFSVCLSAYVKFRNASQDERLSIITRMNLLELIELRAKSWQISDGLNTYYKHKASDVQVLIQKLTLSTHTPRLDARNGISYVFAFFYFRFFIEQPETIPSAVMNDITLLGTSPPANTSLAPNLLSPGELIRTSGKFTKPTKIPGKNYSKDEVVIRNADSGKGMRYFVR